MRLELQKFISVGVPLVWASLLWGSGIACASQLNNEIPKVEGLDHIVVAVDDLESAVAGFRNLGFTIKPGRLHANGIRNAHVKFEAGEEIELLTVDIPQDGLASEYRSHFLEGNGPAFVGFYTPEIEMLTRYLNTAGQSHQQSTGQLSFPKGSPLRHVFFGQRNASPTDVIEHFDHANSARGLVGVWIAGDDLFAERELLTILGFAPFAKSFKVPSAVRGEIAIMPQAEVRLMPGSQQWLPGRKVIGATIRVGSMELVLQVLKSAGVQYTSVNDPNLGSSIYISPIVANGIWLEFREY